MTDEELKKLIGGALDSAATMAMTHAATLYAEDYELPPVRIGIALLLASVGVLSTELNDEQLAEVFAFVHRTTRNARDNG